MTDSPMSLALQEAQKAFAQGEIPVGTVVVDGKTGAILATAHNRVEEHNDPTAHAELLALRGACEKRGSKFLPDCDLYVTLEPCPMCAQAISFARIRRLYYGAFDPKMGGVDHGPRIFTSSSCHHKPEVIGGLQEDEASSLLKTFFAKKR